MRTEKAGADANEGDASTRDVSLTNSIAFGPTDAMLLSVRAKPIMGLESAISAVTVLLVAARAVNVLRSSRTTVPSAS